MYLSTFNLVKSDDAVFLRNFYRDTEKVNKNYQIFRNKIFTFFGDFRIKIITYFYLHN